MSDPRLDEHRLAEVRRLAAGLETASQDARDEALAGLGGGPGDPVVLGVVLGDYVHRIATGAQADAAALWPVVELLRAAGADEEVARQHAARLRGEEP
ncbi:hypothetical protein [Spirilliplanes yamanashiensis]|uniref:Uncharacterized protein n=1 Tax=Spirilliplanes yamanashiensis TaxID=42233 RepID=A0A8J3Y7W2_9ACTN|nr:hypothetical protein [Spirilliplanes yamanashiensis]MDP9817370.1 hypothetical protein [Spirilliplanes yamanashiensis]GIJ02979.1 hypothetical protein Sya03_23310 [Spirilliplanes yamanashiensis]